MAKQKNVACEEYYKAYIEMSDTRKSSFSRICNKLLNENFIYGQKQEDKSDYYEILLMRSTIENYFIAMDYELVHVDTFKIFYIKTLADRNRTRLKKIDTVIILILRLLHHRGTLEVNTNSSSDISITVGKMVAEINQTGIFKTQIPVTEYKKSLRMLKRYKIIDYTFTDLKEDSIITIFPTILYVAKIENIDMLNSKLKTYITAKGVDEDEASEDQID